jgi:hypothetical protein
VIVIAAVVLAGAIAGSAWRIGHKLRKMREDARRDRVMTIMTLLSPGLGAAQADPKALLVWQPLANAARAIFPEEFASLDRIGGSRFPFSSERLQAAHGQWTADWLAWERAHDAEYKRRAAASERELSGSDDTNLGSAARATLEAIEREKLDLYQRRYEEYVRVAKALQALVEQKGTSEIR